MDYKTSPDHENARRVIESFEALGIEFDLTGEFPAIAAMFTDTTPLQNKVIYGVGMAADATDIIVSVNDIPGFDAVPFNEGARLMNEFNRIKSDNFVCSGTLFVNEDHIELRYYIDKSDHALQANLGECIKRIQAYVYEIERVILGEALFDSLILKGEAPFPSSNEIVPTSTSKSVSSNEEPKKKKGLFGKLFS